MIVKTGKTTITTRTGDLTTEDIVAKRRMTGHTTIGEEMKVITTGRLPIQITVMTGQIVVVLIPGIQAMDDLQAAVAAVPQIHILMAHAATAIVDNGEIVMVIL